MDSKPLEQEKLVWAS